MRTLADRLRITDKSFASISVHTDDLRALIISAATGDPTGSIDSPEKKTWKKHAQSWFKSVKGGEDLASKADAAGVIKKLEPQLLPLINSILGSVGVDQIKSLTDEG
ncbi:MAG: hypothetical protein JKY67_15740 [Pseudomonadales bacterium]|nr:hypothetical protein [Pseudomonadales bacterium]